MGFDFRPRSFNFIQQYKFLELLKDQAVHFDKIYLSFCDEKDFVIKKFVEDLIESGVGSDQLVLEFSDSNPQEFYQQFNMPYIFHYNESNRNLSPCPLFRGVSIPACYLEEAENNNTLLSFVNLLMTQYSSFLKVPDFKFQLDLDWDTEIYTAYLKYLPIEIFSFGINSKVEVCYRNVNLNKISPFFQKLPFEIS